MKKLFKNSIQEKFENVQLNAEQLEALNRLQTDNSTQVIEQKTRRHWLMLASAVVVLMFVLGFLIPDMIKPSNDNLIDEIAAEVVKNHLHRKPLEVKTAKIDGIRSYFTRLDFEPISSRYLSERNLSLLGGRYCSIQGITAAQLRFKAFGKDDVNTLYQVGYDPAVFKLLPDYDQKQEPITRYSKGIKVTIWVEKGVLFALTENS